MIPCVGRYCHNDKYEAAALDASGLCYNCCPAGRMFDMQMKTWAAGPGTSSTKPFFLAWHKHGVQYHGFHPIAPTHSGNGTPSGAFAFTLTMSPGDGLTEADMVAAVRKIMKQKSCPVKQYAWYLEYGDPETKGHPHIHGMYETEKGGVIEKKHFQRAWKIWDPSVKLGAGFRGGYHRPVRSDEAYSQYIKKQDILGESHVT